jgi:hypothetical protein
MGHRVETCPFYSDVEPIRVEENLMKILRKNRNARSLMNAVTLGLGLSVLLSMVLIGAGAISEMQAARDGVDSTGLSAIVSAATAAMPVTETLPAAAPLVIGGDSRLDEFRLDPDSCCIGHY